jgi:hypothetical protein
VGMSQYAITGGEQARNVLVSGGAGDCIIIVVVNWSQRRAFMCHVDRTTDVEALFSLCEKHVRPSGSADEFGLIMASQVFKFDGVKSEHNFAGNNYEDHGNYKRIEAARKKSGYNIVSISLITDPNLAYDLGRSTRIHGLRAKKVGQAFGADAGLEIHSNSAVLKPPKCVFNPY